MFADFYQGRRVLVTGHSGFKGGWLSLWLKHLRAFVWGVGLEPPTKPSLYEVIRTAVFDGETDCDVRCLEDLKAAFTKAAPDIVFHMAARSLVRQSYKTPVETFETNSSGTMNVLEAVRQLELPCSVVVITSDKCYENRGWEYGYRENDPLGGHDVYSASKAAAEIVVQAWRQSFFAVNPKLGLVASARGGNVIGGGDYAQDRLVPDCVRALLVGQPIQVRNPSATRPWQHVLDCLSGYLWLGACLGKAQKGSPLASAFNFGPAVQANVPVLALVEEILKIWPGRCEKQAEAQAPHEAQKLSLAIDKAAALLEWTPTWGVQEAIHQTVSWYYQRHVLKRADMAGFCLTQIQSYEAAARKCGVRWASAT
jgi:CDP-glucose 4,6-dehydratase